MKFHLRDEARFTERRAPITPTDAGTLLAAGHELWVEKSAKRIFSDTEYVAVGATLVDTGSWVGAPLDRTILGLKELPPKPDALGHSFIHFAHLYKDQSGWQDEIARFVRGGGRHFDLEYLSKNGRRTAAFGYWAGWMGAALAAWRFRARNHLPHVNLESFPSLSSFESREKVIEILKSFDASDCKALVIGAKGRSGSGAVEALKTAGFSVTEWDIAETRKLDRTALMAHDVLVNCVLMTGPGLQLLSPSDLSSTDNHLSVISDVSCDPFSDFNPLPIYDRPTSWEDAFITLGENGQGKAVELTAIDNLPSLLPRESSEDFSAQLLPCLLNYPQGDEWLAAAVAFDTAVKRAK